jgi:hypothetical protein
VNLTHHLRTLSNFDVYFGRFIAATAASVQIWDFVRREYQIYSWFQAGGEVLIDQRYVFMHFQIAFALLVASICLWSRRAGAFYVSIFAAGWADFQYVCWFMWSRTILTSAGIDHWPEQTPHSLGLGGATGWNVAVLLLTVVLLLWQTKTLFGGTRLFRSAAV